GGAKLYQQAIEVARQIGSRESENIYLTNLGAARLGLAQYAQAEADLRQVLEQTASPKSCALTETYSFLSMACLGQGKRAEALRNAQRALALAQESENYLDVGLAWRTLGSAVAACDSTAASESGQPLPAPESCFTASLSVLQQIRCEGE